MSGVELIAEERSRQVGVEGYDAKHDDLHRDGSIVRAAVCYADTARVQVFSNLDGQPLPRCYWHKDWPFDREEFKPSPDAIRNLVKAGAMIAAEIDRLMRARSEPRDDQMRGFDTQGR